MVDGKMVRVDGGFFKKKSEWFLNSVNNPLEGDVRELGVGPEFYWWTVNIVKVKQKCSRLYFLAETTMISLTKVINNAPFSSVASLFLGFHISSWIVIFDFSHTCIMLYLLCT